jgi:hypothetical protein
MPAILRRGLALALLAVPLLLGACATSPCGVTASPQYCVANPVDPYGAAAGLAPPDGRT